MSGGLYELHRNEARTNTTHSLYKPSEQSASATVDVPSSHRPFRNSRLLVYPSPLGTRTKTFASSMYNQFSQKSQPQPVQFSPRKSALETDKVRQLSERFQISAAVVYDLYSEFASMKLLEKQSDEAAQWDETFTATLGGTSFGHEEAPSLDIDIEDETISLRIFKNYSSIFN